MRRKIIKQGVDTHTITLPIKWIRRNSIKAGDEVEIHEKKNTLIVSTEKRNKTSKKEIKVNDHDSYLVTRLITNSYKKGIDELTLIFGNIMPIKEIEKALSTYTIGYEITDVSDKKCIIRSFSKDEKDNISITSRKFFLIVKEMIKVLVENLSERKNKDNQLLYLKHNVHKLSNFAIRSTNKSITDANNIRYNSHIFTNVHLFANKLDYIHKHIITERKIFPHTRKLLDILFDMFSLFYDSYYRKDLDSIYRFSLQKKKFVSLLDKNIDKKNGRILLQASMAMRCLEDSIGHVVGLLTD